jgi:hypothetical protein
MTSEGHPYAVFRRAIASRNAAVAWAAAADLPRLSLEDALALCLLAAETASQGRARGGALDRPLP